MRGRKVFRSAGVPPVIFLFSMQRKIAGPLNQDKRDPGLRK